MQPPPSHEALRRAAIAMLPALLLLPLAWALPSIPLDGAGAVAVLLVSESGKYGLPFIALALAALIAGRRRRELLLLLLLPAALVGATAWVNEHGVKPGFARPRPDIVALARAGALGLSAERFYTLPDKPTRAEHLRGVLESPGFDAVRLHPWIRAHWITETGFSFPSGHSTAAMMFAVFFLTLALGRVEGWRRLPFLLLPWWALLICWSRPLLRVHTPADVVSGGLAGAVLGAGLFVVAARLLDDCERGRPSGGQGENRAAGAR